MSFKCLCVSRRVSAASERSGSQHVLDTGQCSKCACCLKRLTGGWLLPAAASYVASSRAAESLHVRSLASAKSKAAGLGDIAPVGPDDEEQNWLEIPSEYYEGMPTEKVEGIKAIIKYIVEHNEQRLSGDHCPGAEYLSSCPSFLGAQASRR